MSCLSPFQKEKSIFTENKSCSKNWGIFQWEWLYELLGIRASLKVLTNDVNRKIWEKFSKVNTSEHLRLKLVSLALVSEQKIFRKLSFGQKIKLHPMLGSGQQKHILREHILKHRNIFWEISFWIEILT